MFFKIFTMIFLSGPRFFIYIFLFYLHYHLETLTYYFEHIALKMDPFKTLK